VLARHSKALASPNHLKGSYLAIGRAALLKNIASFIALPQLI
jgi:hypothetical protein